MANELKARVERFMDRLQREDVCMHGFILSVGGQIKAKAYYPPFEEGQAHRMYSVSKTMTGLAIGMLMEDGKLNLEDKVTDYFQDWLPAKQDPQLSRLTIHHLLRFSTNHRDDTYWQIDDPNWARSYFEVPSTHEPGLVFHYDTSATQVLSELVRRLSGKEVLDFLEERLFKPAGATDPKHWIRDPEGHCWGGSGLCMSLRDMHKIARLCMEGGYGIVPEWYLKEMTRLQTPTPLNVNEEERYGYGLQCWQTRSGWAMYGLGAQLAICCPDKDLLLCTIADTRLDICGVQRVYDAFYDEIEPWIGKEDMEETEFIGRINVLPDCGVRKHEHEGPFHFGENALTLHTLELRGQEVFLENARGKGVLRFGIGENIVDTFPGLPDEPTFCSGGWVAPDCLRIRCYLIGDSPCGVDLVISFGEADGKKSVCVLSRRSAEPQTDYFEGVATGYQNPGS